MESNSLHISHFSSSVPEPVINQTQGKLFAFLWRNKKDRIKRQALYQPLAKGGLSFPCFRTAVKALRLSWIGRILSDSNDNWKAIPNHYLEKHGGLSFLLKCNYDIKYLDNRLPSFYRELLRFFMNYVVSMSPLLKEILSYGTTRRFLLTRSQYSGNLGRTKRSSLLRTC